MYGRHGEQGMYQDPLPSLDRAFHPLAAKKSFLREKDYYPTAGDVYPLLSCAMPQQQWDLSSAQAGQKFNVTDEELIRELKNLQKQNSISAKELFEQVGRLIEVMDSPNIRGGAAQDGGGAADNFKDVLDTIANVIKGQADFMDRMNTISEFIQKNMDVMGKLPGAIDEMKEASKKLGELFAKIYNRPF